VFDPKVLLKATSWQNLALAIASILFLVLSNYGVIVTESWMIALAVAVLLVTGCLAMAASFSAALSLFPVHRWIARRQRIRTAQKAVADYIPHMTEQERQIIAYLLAKNQKMFTAESDGGYASPLLSRGIVVYALVFGAHYDFDDDIPMRIPDHVWDILKTHEASFPYTPQLSDRSGVEVQPWRIP
jgi:hypothetical protein